MACVALDICQADIQCSPALTTVDQRKRELAAERSSHYNHLGWCTEEVLNHNIPSITVSCVRGLLPFLFVYFLLHKWRKYKGAHPIASRVAARGAATYHRIAGRVGRFYAKKKRFIMKKVTHFILWCIVYYYVAYGKTERACMVYVQEKVSNAIKKACQSSAACCAS